MVGRAWQAYSSRSTCPDACELKGGGGCYAENHHVKRVWDQVDKEGLDLDAFCDQLYKIPKGAYLRLWVAGDWPGKGDHMDERACVQIASAAPISVTSWSYTHYPLEGNRLALRHVQNLGVVVNIFAKDKMFCDKYRAIGQKHVSILPKDTPKHVLQEAGLVWCPQKIGVDIDCRTCLNCFTDWHLGIAFPPHGNRKRLVEATAQKNWR